MYLAQVNLVVEIEEKRLTGTDKYDMLLPLEWIENEDLRNDLLKFIEVLLIRSAKPVINKQLASEDLEEEKIKVPKKFILPIEYITDIDKLYITPFLKELSERVFIDAKQKSFKRNGFLKFY